MSCDEANGGILRDTLAEWLRRRPAKPMGSPRVGSNPTGVALFSKFLMYMRIHALIIMISIFCARADLHAALSYSKCSVYLSRCGLSA